MAIVQFCAKLGICATGKTVHVSAMPSVALGNIEAWYLSPGAQRFEMFRPWQLAHFGIATTQQSCQFVA